MTQRRIETRHTSELDGEVLDAVRRVMAAAFAGEFSALDWEHALGGMHALVWEDGELVGHGSVVQRRLLHGGRALRCGYVEAVGVRPERQRRGYGAAIIDELERVVRGAYDLGALSAGEDAIGFYLARRWEPWAGPTFALTPAGVVRTADEDGGVMVFPVAAPLDLRGDLICDWRDGDVW